MMPCDLDECDCHLIDEFPEDEYADDDRYEFDYLLSTRYDDWGMRY